MLNKLKMSFAICAMGIASCTFVHAQNVPDVSFEVTQVGSDVVIEGEGALDLQELTLAVEDSGHEPGIGVDVLVLVGPDPSVDIYVGNISGPNFLGPPLQNRFDSASSSSGDAFGPVFGIGGFHVPTNYVSGSPLSGTAVLENATLQSLGLTEGVYEFEFGTNIMVITVASGGQSVLLGDCDQNGVVDFADIPSFIAVLQSGSFLEEADCNEDDVVDFSDIPAFISILSSQ